MHRQVVGLSHATWCLQVKPQKEEKKKREREERDRKTDRKESPEEPEKKATPSQGPAEYRPGKTKISRTFPPRKTRRDKGSAKKICIWTIYPWMLSSQRHGAP